MIAKLLVGGKDRKEVLERSRRALANFQVTGIPTTLSFHRELLENPAFQDAAIHTRWLDERGLA
jgi:acetyl/propionyl-CoA carboxylase alpha subunit